MKNEQFSSRLGFILVSAGCAIGLGNVWKFPYICGENGGAVFILIYLLCLFLIGLPILICEYSIGRGSGYSLMKAYKNLEPEGTHWHRSGVASFVGNYVLMMFYTMVAGWMMYYAYKTAGGEFVGADTDTVKGIFNDMLGNPGTMIFWTLLVIVLAFGVCALGLENGVEKITKVIMLLLIVLMIVMVVRSVTLPGASKGLEFYLIPDFNKLHERGMGNVIFAALTHAFFTLSVGIGSMEIFGSYLLKERRLTGEAISVTLLDTFVAITAGLIIVPSCFAYNVEPDAGPPLLFITLPSVFNHMAGGRIWGTCFFVFMTFAAISTVIAVFENIVKMTIDAREWERKKAVAVNMIGVAVLSMPAILGYNVLSGIKPLGDGSTIMDLEDFLVSYNLLPLGSLIAILFCVRKNGWGYDNFMNEVNTGEGVRFPRGLKWYMTYIVPLLIVVVYVKGYYDLFAPKGTKALAFWMGVAALLLMGVFAIIFLGNKKSNGVKEM